MFESFNYVEAGLWCAIGLVFLIVAPKSAAAAGRRCLVLGVTFVAFGLSDVVEVRTGAWWRPWWLLAWKGGCLAVMIGELVRYIRRRGGRRG